MPSFTYGALVLDPPDLPSNTAITAVDYLFNRYPLFTIAEDEPRPRVLQLSSIATQGGVRIATLPTELQVGWVLGDCKVPFNLRAETGNVCVGAEITYGNDNLQIGVKFDWVGGSYQIPPCQYLQVALVAYRVNTTGLTSFPYRFEASARPGVCPVPKRPTQTATFSVFGSGGTQEIERSRHSRWIDFWSGDEEEIGSADAPIISIKSSAATGDSQPNAKKDYVAGTWFPSGMPLEVSPGRQTFITVQNDGTQTAKVTVKQFLEL